MEEHKSLDYPLAMIDQISNQVFQWSVPILLAVTTYLVRSMHVAALARIDRLDKKMTSLLVAMLTLGPQLYPEHASEINETLGAVFRINGEK